MKAIHKLVVKSYLGPLILSSFIVQFILIMNFLWRYIEDLVGKSLGMDIIAELLFHVSITVLPMSLPLSILLSSIIMMGDLGENYELLAMKSAGMSLLSIMKPLIIIVGAISIGSFFISNNMVPYSMKKMNALIYDITKQKQSIEFKDGVFFNDIGDMSIRVGTQDPKTKLLTDILIYDSRDRYGDMTTTVADSGYIKISDDYKNLQVTLYNGETYEQSRNRNWLNKNKLTHRIFKKQRGFIPLDGFAIGNTDDALFDGSYAKRIDELNYWIDSLQQYSDKKNATSYAPLLEKYIFSNQKSLVFDSLKISDTIARHPILTSDSITGLDIYQQQALWKLAKSNAYNSKGSFRFNEESAKSALDQLYKYQVEWHKKLLLPVSIMVFLLIGAPLGAIIRKGGLGMPIIVSIFFFITYYMVSLTGEKMGYEGSWVVYFGMWLPIMILAPIAVFLTYKATNDSSLFNMDRYIILYDRAKESIKKMTNNGLKIWNSRKKH